MGLFSTIGFIILLVICIVLGVLVIIGIASLFFIVVVGPTIVMIDKLRDNSSDS